MQRIWLFVCFTFYIFHVSLHASPINVGAPDSGIELGLGWDSQRAVVIPNRCIRFAPVQERGQTSRMTISEVSDSSELMEKLNVSAGMSVQTLSGGGSAQAQFASSTKVNSSSNALLIRATVDNGVLFVGPSQPLNVARSAYPHDKAPAGDQPWWLEEDLQLSPMIELTEKALDLLGDGSVEEVREFERYCGDSFVSAIYSGAEVLAVMKIEANSKTQAKSTKTSVKAQFSAWSVEGSTDNENARKEESKRVSIEFTQIGGAEGIIPTNRDEFMKKVNGLAEEAELGPQFHSMDLTPYSDLPNWPISFVPNTEDNPEEAILNNYYWTLTSLFDLVQDALAEPAQYVGTMSDARKQALMNLQDEITRQRQEIYKVLTRVAELAGQPTETKTFFGLFTEVNEDLVQEKQVLQEEIAKRIASLKAFSFNQLNPNLLKLHLPLPCSAVDICTKRDGCIIDKQNVVEFYVAKQSRRICQVEPTSEECMSNQQLAGLFSKVSETKMKAAECRPKPAPGRGGGRGGERR